MEKCASTAAQLTRLRHLLGELVDLVNLIEPTESDADPTLSEPILALTFHDMDTRTWIDAEGSEPCLTVAVTLPKSALSPSFQPCLPAPAPLAPMRSEAPLWNVDVGAHVLLLRMPLVLLQDERSLLDTILDACDSVRAWQRTVEHPAR